MPPLLLEITTRLLVSVYNISLGYRDSFLSRLMLLMQLLRVWREFDMSCDILPVRITAG